MQSIGSGSWLLVALVFALVPSTQPLGAEAEYDAAWLRYARIEDKAARERYAALPAVVVALGDSPVVKSAQAELIGAVRGMLGRTLRASPGLPEENAIVLGTFASVSQAVPEIGEPTDLGEDGYWIRSVNVNGKKHLIVTARNDRGVLFGTFALLGKMTLEQPLDDLNEQQTPRVPLRMVQQRDRLDGSVVHGYSGTSIFWEGGGATKEIDRVRDFGRLLASVGINSVSANDASAGPEVLKPEGLHELGILADVLRPWGIRLFIAMDLPGVRKAAGNESGAPFDEQAAGAWKSKTDEIYQAIPDLGGIVLTAEVGGASTSPKELPKANNEPASSGAPGQEPGGNASAPETAQANAEIVGIVNQCADVLKSHGGVIFFRTTAMKTPADGGPAADPALVSCVSLRALDGQFTDNVVLQIPAGSLNSHLRQPPSPLFGNVEKTSTAIEFDISQKFLGQQRHLCFLVPTWEAALSFDMWATDKPTPVKELLSGKVFQHPLGAFVVTSNVGRNPHWLRHPLAMANLHGFGRLAWNHELASKAIAEEWARRTFGHDPLVVGTIVEMLLQSWQLFENYTGPLGLGTLTDLRGSGYGPNVEASSTDPTPRLGADDAGVGVDRTVATGSRFVGQYRPPVAELLESLETCPDDLLLFIHHVPYKHPLKSGKTVIQHIYNSHYNGTREAARMVDKWQLLEGRVDDQRYRDVLTHLTYQAGHAQVWRDAVCNWFLRKSGITDDEGRVGNSPRRFEAESMQLDGYEPQNVTPWETASGGQCVASVAQGVKGTVSFKYDGEPGWFDLSVNYYDENDGASQFQLLVAGEVVDQWVADDALPGSEPNGDTSTRHVTRSLALRKGDELRISTVANGGEQACIDYVAINAVKN